MYRTSRGPRVQCEKLYSFQPNVSGLELKFEGVQYRAYVRGYIGDNGKEHGNYHITELY